MNIKNFESWSKAHKKEIIEVFELEYKNLINIGNGNSYSDASIPLSNFSLKNKKSNLKNLQYVSSDTILLSLINNNNFLYGVPGRKNVTLGGAVASDVHGKDNVWGGSFRKNIKTIKLQISTGEIIEVSKSKNREIFEATIGGYGLTGSIIECELENNLETFNYNFNKIIDVGIGLDTLLNKKRFLNGNYWVAWVDLLSPNFNWVAEKYIPYNITTSEVNEKNIKDFELFLPLFGKNKFKLMQMVNKVYFNINKISKNKIVSLDDVLFPLNRYTDTRLLSPKGKINQLQFSINDSNINEIERLLKNLVRTQVPLLCSVKRFAEQEEFCNLSFYQPGWTFAIDFSEEYLNKTELLKIYDELIRLNCKIYLAKDSNLTENQFKKMYPNYFEWEKIVKKIDPHSKFQSEMSYRLGLKRW